MYNAINVYFWYIPIENKSQIKLQKSVSIGKKKHDQENYIEVISCSK